MSEIVRYILATLLTIWLVLPFTLPITLSYLAWKWYTSRRDK